jgi:hypothetical protein
MPCASFARPRSRRSASMTERGREAVTPSTEMKGYPAACSRGREAAALSGWRLEGGTSWPGRLSGLKKEGRPAISALPGARRGKELVLLSRICRSLVLIIREVLASLRSKAPNRGDGWLTLLRPMESFRLVPADRPLARSLRSLPRWLLRRGQRYGLPALTRSPWSWVSVHR